MRMPQVMPQTNTVNMKEFKLKTKDGEVIAKTTSPTLEEAIIYFAKRKKLTKKALCEIFLIEN